MEHLLSWYRLKTVPGIGNLLFKRLYDRFKSPEQVFQSSFDDLLRIDGIHRNVAQAILAHRLPEWVKPELDQVLKKGYRIITFTDSDYPPFLLQIPDPPPLLYVYGTLPHSTRNIAVVGSRTPTRYGLSTTRRICKELAELDITVVSGMARGIDTAAHNGVLDGGGKTIAVMGSGFERVYPGENIPLFHRISENGAVISEFPLNAGPEPHHFPIRNRIISGICLGTVVIEAAEKSGSLITARLANEQGREVFAVPGYIHSYKSIGTHRLIKQGAKLVEQAQDIIDELPYLLHMNVEVDTKCEPEIMPSLSEDETSVFNALGPYPIHIDELVRKIGMASGKLSSVLLQLELKGAVHQATGKLFSTGDTRHG